MMDFAGVINELSEYMDGEHWGVDGIESTPDLSRYQKQTTGMSTLPIEYVCQTGDEYLGFFSGTIYFPLEYSDGDGGKLFLKIWFG